MIELQYDSTAARPQWDELPPDFRDALADRLGASVVDVQVSGCGFTPGFAAVLTTSDGRRHFVKAAPLKTEISTWYRQEARFTQALPLAVPTARLRWSADLAGHFALCLDAIDGAHTARLPWDPALLEAALAALAQAAAALATRPPADPAESPGSAGPGRANAELLELGPEPWANVVEAALSQWRKHSTGAADPPPLPVWALPHTSELAALETGFIESTAQVTTLIHCDLRLDNLVFDANGKAWICDWNFLAVGPAWFDLVTLLISAEASGLDPDPLFRAHPTAQGVTDDTLDGALAAVLGYYLTAGARPGIEASPLIRPHQRYYAKLALRWLSRRRGWPQG